MRILLVDDEVTLATTLAAGLTGAGFAVELAHDGLTGLQRAQDGSFDVLVLDIMLPGLNGYEVCRTLRSRQVWTPVLVLTAKDGEYDETDARSTSAPTTTCANRSPSRSSSPGCAPSCGAGPRNVRRCSTRGG